MTFNEEMTTYLTDHGMFDSQARLVMEMVKDHELFKEMRGRLNEETTDYPTAIKSMCFMYLRVVALEYIDKNCPAAWFRPVFLPEEEQRKVIPEAFQKERSTSASPAFAMPYGQINVKALVTHFGVKKGETYSVKVVEDHDDCWEVTIDGVGSHIAKKHFSDPIELN